MVTGSQLSRGRPRLTPADLGPWMKALLRALES